MANPRDRRVVQPRSPSRLSTFAMRPLHQILAGEPTLSGLLDRRQRELALEQRVHSALPPALAGHVRVAGAHPPELVLVAASGAAGALLRHRAPDLLEALAGEGWKFTGIRIRVQARSASGMSGNRVPKQLDRIAAAKLRALAAALADPGLSAALERLASHSSSASEHDDQSLELQEHEDSEK